jgi:putative peptidoglycan lipid II flippase
LTGSQFEVEEGGPPEPGAAAAEEAALPEVVSSPGLVRASLVVAVGTGLSRLTGFARLAATAYAIGFARLTDTYTLANTTPNIVYELLLGGVLSATLVPLFVQQAEEEDDEGTSAVVSVAVALLVAVCVVAFFAAPLIVRLYTVGVEGDVAADQQEVATALLRLFVPQILFFGLTALGTALLNARRHFAVPAFAPALNNIAVTAMLLALPRLAGGTPTLEQVRDDPVLLLTLGLGTTVGIVLMTVVLLPALKRAGVRLRPHLDLHHPAVRHVGRLSGWTLGYVLTNQLSLLVVLVLANREQGGVSAYTGAFIFFQLPHALVAVSLMTTLVPELASAARREDHAAYRARFSTGVRLMALVILPAATGYVVLARPIVSALLERGALSVDSADLTADTLAAFALGLFGFSIYLFALRGFYALRDTRTPFLLNVGENVLNGLLALALIGPLGIPGLAVAYAAAYTVAAVVSLVVLRRRVGSLDGRRSARSIAKLVVASATMALAVWLVARSVGGPEGVGAIVRTGAGVVVGAAVFAVATVVLRVEEVAPLVARMRRVTSGAGQA